MGVRDVTTNEYLDTRERVADLLNGFVYHGKEFVRPEHVKQIKNVLSRAERKKHAQRNRKKILRSYMIYSQEVDCLAKLLC